MIVVGIDPGASYFGWGLVSTGAFTAHLRSVGFRAGCDVSGLVADAYVVELPQVYRGRSEPKSVRDLTAAAGAIIGLLKTLHQGVPILCPQPAEWKGQIPKDVHQSRIKAAIGEHGRRVLLNSGLSKTHLGHALDGVGLALWGEKQLANTPNVVKV